MAVVQTSGYCATCGQNRPFVKQKINNVLHLILTILTLGLWGIVWIILGMANSAKKPTCTVCGTPFEPQVTSTYRA